MVLIKKHAIIRRVKDITIGSTLTLALLGSTAFMQGCGSDNNGAEGEYETSYSKGVQTFIEETEKGVFKIVDEKTVDPANSKVFISYLDGRKDTLNLEEAKRIVDQREYYNNNAHHGYYHESALSNVLFYGGMGYLLGRSFSSPPVQTYYANPNVYQRSQENVTTLNRSRVTKPSNSRSGFFGRSKSSSHSSGSHSSRGFGG